MVAGHRRKIEQVAGIKFPALCSLCKSQIDLFFNPIAVAGWADHSAAATAQAFIPPLFPDLGLKFQVHQFRHDVYLYLSLELGFI